MDNSGVRVLIGLVGFLIAGMSLVCIGMGGVIELQKAEWNNIGGMVGIFGCLLVTACFGAGLSWFGFRGATEDEGIPARAEQQLLNLARESEGKVTPAEVAAHTDLSLKRSQALLTELSESGLIRLEVDTDGDQIYVFPGLDADDTTFEKDRFEAELARAIESDDALPDG